MLEEEFCQKSFGGKVTIPTVIPSPGVARNSPRPRPLRGQPQPPPQLTCKPLEMLPLKYKQQMDAMGSMTARVALLCIELTTPLKKIIWETKAMMLTQKKCARIKNRQQISCLGICKFNTFILLAVKNFLNFDIK